MVKENYTVQDILEFLEQLDNRAEGRSFIRQLSRLMKEYETSGRKPAVMDYGVDKLKILHSLLDDVHWLIGSHAAFWEKEKFEEVGRHFYDEKFYADIAELGMIAEADFELKVDLDLPEAIDAIRKIEMYNPILASLICQTVTCPGMPEYERFNLYRLSDKDARSIPAATRPYLMPDSPIWRGELHDDLALCVMKVPYADTGEFYYTIPKV